RLWRAQRLAPQLGVGRRQRQRRLVQRGFGKCEAVLVDGDLADRRIHLHRDRDMALEDKLSGIGRQLQIIMDRHDRSGQHFACIRPSSLRPCPARQKGHKTKTEPREFPHRHVPKSAAESLSQAGRISTRAEWRVYRGGSAFFRISAPPSLPCTTWGVTTI